MNPSELTTYLRNVVKHEINLSVMMWGAPGIGKSSIVKQVAEEFSIELTDVRLSQLAPSDLRGLPVPDKENRVSQWFAPEFLPQSGSGILFLDELNMAAPAVQGIAQQLILDRQVGSYDVPKGWFIWAAGNRKEDQAAVYEMPAPLANRFIHLQVTPHYDSFRQYAVHVDLDEQIQAFLAFRPELLFEMSSGAHAWPSPRSWEMASQLHRSGLDIAPAVGEGAAGEFYTYIDVYEHLPDVEGILSGRGEEVAFPGEISLQYATTVALSVRVSSATEAIHSTRWLLHKADREFTQLFFKNVMDTLRKVGGLGVFIQRMQEDEGLGEQLNAFQKNIEGLLVHM